MINLTVSLRTIAVFKMLLNIQETQVMANNFVPFDTLAKHTPVNNKRSMQPCFLL